MILVKLCTSDVNLTRTRLLVALNVCCRLSLKYHPDKNKNKGAQEKFAEINNGRTLLSF